MSYDDVPSESRAWDSLYGIDLLENIIGKQEWGKKQSDTEQKQDWTEGTAQLSSATDHTVSQNVFWETTWTTASKESLFRKRRE